MFIFFVFTGKIEKFTWKCVRTPSFFKFCHHNTTLHSHRVGSGSGENFPDPTKKGPDPQPCREGVSYLLVLGNIKVLLLLHGLLRQNHQKVQLFFVRSRIVMGGYMLLYPRKEDCGTEHLMCNSGLVTLPLVSTHCLLWTSFLKSSRYLPRYRVGT